MYEYSIKLLNTDKISKSGKRKMGTVGLVLLK
jgi:hypothetical protein